MDSEVRVFLEQDLEQEITEGSDGGTGGARPTRALGWTLSLHWVVFFLYMDSCSHMSLALFAPGDDDSMVFINNLPLYFITLLYDIPQLFLLEAEVSISLVTVRSE
jgi:hypothetical protein